LSLSSSIAIVDGYPVTVSIIKAEHSSITSSMIIAAYPFFVHHCSIMVSIMIHGHVFNSVMIIHDNDYDFDYDNIMD
jgi:hypothetical protein